MFPVYGESSGFPSIELSRKSFHSQVELCAEIPRISDEYKLLAMRRGRVSLVASMHDCGAAIQQGCNALCKCLEDFPEDFMNDNSIPLFETTEHIFTSVNTIYQLVFDLVRRWQERTRVVVSKCAHTALVAASYQPELTESSTFQTRRPLYLKAP